MDPGRAVGLFHRYLGGLEEERTGGPRGSKPSVKAIGGRKRRRGSMEFEPGPSVDATRLDGLPRLPRVKDMSSAKITK